MKEVHDVYYRQLMVYFLDVTGHQEPLSLDGWLTKQHVYVYLQVVNGLRNETSQMNRTKVKNTDRPNLL